MQIGGRAWGGAHPEHHAHVCDFGGVEAQRLVERRRVLPSRKQGIRWVRGELRAGRREAAGDGGASSVCRPGLDYRFEAGDGEERTWNMDCIFVTLEVSKLSGWLNLFAACRESEGGHVRCGATCGSGGGTRRATVVQTACRGELDCRLGVWHGEERTPNMECMFVTLEVSRFSGWLNADTRCRDSEGGHTVRGQVRAWRWEAAGDGGAHAARREALDCNLGA